MAIMNLEQFYSISRSVLKIGGAVLVENGYVSDANWQSIMGGFVVIIGLVWSHCEHDPNSIMGKKVDGS